MPNRYDIYLYAGRRRPILARVLLGFYGKPIEESRDLWRERSNSCCNSGGFTGGGGENDVHQEAGHSEANYSRLDAIESIEKTTKPSNKTWTPFKRGLNHDSLKFKVTVSSWLNTHDWILPRKTSKCITKCEAVKISHLTSHPLLVHLLDGYSMVAIFLGLVCFKAPAGVETESTRHR